MNTSPDTDAIVVEVHEVRAAIAARFHDDLHPICEDARRCQAAAGRIPVSLPPRLAGPTAPTPKQVN